MIIYRINTSPRRANLNTKKTSTRESTFQCHRHFRRKKGKSVETSLAPPGRLHPSQFKHRTGEKSWVDSRGWGGVTYITCVLSSHVSCHVWVCVSLEWHLLTHPKTFAYFFDFYPHRSGVRHTDLASWGKLSTSLGEAFDVEGSRQGRWEIEFSCIFIKLNKFDFPLLRTWFVWG